MLLKACLAGSCALTIGLAVLYVMGNEWMYPFGDARFQSGTRLAWI